MLSPQESIRDALNNQKAAFLSGLNVYFKPRQENQSITAKLKANEIDLIKKFSSYMVYTLLLNFGKQKLDFKVDFNLTRT